MAKVALNDAAGLRLLLEQRDYDGLRVACGARRASIRALLPLVRVKLGERGPERVEGLRTNWAGRGLMA